MPIAHAQSESLQYSATMLLLRKLHQQRILLHEGNIFLPREPRPQIRRGFESLTPLSRAKCVEDNLENTTESQFGSQ